MLRHVSEADKTSFGSKVSKSEFSKENSNDDRTDTTLSLASEALVECRVCSSWSRGTLHPDQYAHDSSHNWLEEDMRDWVLDHIALIGPPRCVTYGALGWGKE